MTKKVQNPIGQNEAIFVISDFEHWYYFNVFCLFLNEKIIINKKG